MGGGVTDHILDQRPNGLAPVIEMFSDPDAGIAIVEVQRSVLVLHIKGGNFIRFGAGGVPLVNQLLGCVEHRLIAGAQVNGFVHIVFEIVQSSTSIIQ